MKTRYRQLRRARLAVHRFHLLLRMLRSFGRGGPWFDLPLCAAAPFNAVIAYSHRVLNHCLDRPVGAGEGTERHAWHEGSECFVRDETAEFVGTTAPDHKVKGVGQMVFA